MKQKRIAAGVLACLLLTGLAGCGKKGDSSDGESVQGTAVEVQQVEAGAMAAESSLAGTVTAKNPVQVFPQLGGQVLTLNVSEGDTVAKGQVLFQVDTSTVTSTLSSLQQSYSATKSATDEGIATARIGVQNAQTGVQNAQIAVDQAQTQYDNTKALYDAGAASSQALTTAEQGLQQAQAGLRQAKAGVQTAQAAVQQAEASQRASLAQIQASIDQIQAQAKLGTVTAPVSGLVTAVNVERGGMAGQTAPAVVIAEDGNVEISVSVSETVLSGLTVGDTAQATLPSVSDEPFSCTISTIAPAADQQTRLYPVTLALPADQKPAIGVFANVTLYTDQRADAVYVPTEAILSSGDTQYLFITTDKRPDKDKKKSDVGAGDGPWAKRVEIQTGLVGDGVTEVTQGLSGGETLIVKGQSYLSDGSLVRVVSGEDDA